MSESYKPVMVKNLDSMEEIQTLIESGLLPSSLGTPERVLTVLQTGRELGMSPMQAFNNIHVIGGRPVISSAMMGALLSRSGVDFDYTKDFVTEGDKIITELEFEYYNDRLKKTKKKVFSITWKQMEVAGYTEKQNWTKYPKEMMRARCMSYAVRALFPHILVFKGGGLYTDAEIVDSTTNEGAQMNITDDGTVEVEYTESN